MASWVSWAWQQSPINMVEKFFKKCCISTALDGSEIDLPKKEVAVLCKIIAIVMKMNAGSNSDTGSCDSDSDA